MSQKNHYRRERARAMVRVLKRLYPKAGMALHFGDHWQLLVSVVLSAQTTDKKVNEVTQKLFKKYRTLEDYVRVDSRSFSRDIKEIGLYRTKAKNILAAATVVQRHYHGKLPKTMEQMIALPGVGRKSANVILGNAYGIVEGIAIDTHVRRFAIRFDLTDSTNPVVIERDLMRLLPRREWFGFTYRIIEYGRNVCPARKHPCERHPLTLLYKRAANRWYSPR